MEILKVKDLVVNYGMIKAVKGASFTVNKGEIVALIGANGAGKTSILHTVTGLLAAKEGSIKFDGKDITKTNAHDIVKLGMAHVPEGRRVFGDLTVIENLKLGAYIRNDKVGIEESLERIYKRFPRLFERKSQVAGTLSGGEQQRVAIARALSRRPSVILADEPTGALDVDTGNSVMTLLERQCAENGAALIIITHDLAVAGRAHTQYRLDHGVLTPISVKRQQIGSLEEFSEVQLAPVTNHAVAPAPGADAAGAAGAVGAAGGAR